MDNWSPHKSAIEVLENDLQETSIDITVEYFPEYSSTLNPTDRVWGLAKEEVANCTAESLDELQELVIEEFETIRADESKLRYCVKDAELEIEA
jgi:transposase